MMHTSKR